jgi:hypothetical protein
MRTLLTSFALIVLTSISLTALGADKSSDLCNDSRVAVWAYCSELEQLGEIVRANPGITPADPKVKGLLNQLDFKGLSTPQNLVRALAREPQFNTAYAAAGQVAAQAVQKTAESFRQDGQAGSPSSAAGTTSLVSKAGAADFLSFAFDAGALTRTVNGSTATITGNLEGMLRGITGTQPLCVYPCDQLNWVDWHVLQPTTVVVVTSVSQSTNETAPVTGQAGGTTATSLTQAAIPTSVGKLSNITARYQLLNKYDPQSKKFKNSWDNAIQGDSNLIKDLIQSNDAVSGAGTTVTAKSDPIDRDEIIRAAAQGDDALAGAFADYYRTQLQKLGTDADVVDKVTTAIKSIKVFQQEWEAMRRVAAGTLLTFEYSYNHPITQPDTHDVKIIYGYAPNSSAGSMFSLNGAFSLYATSPPGAKYGRLHYGQISAEFDRQFSPANNPNLFTLSLAGYWQYQPDPSVLNIAAGTVAPGTSIPLSNGTQEFVGTAGSLWVTQFKFTLNGKSGIKIPIGVKWSNKSDLLSGNRIGAQVGLSYDLSSLNGLFGSNGGQ